MPTVPTYDLPQSPILIIGALVSGINSWWTRKLLSQEEDI